MTEQDFVESGHLTTRSNIDHLCISERMGNLVTNVFAWESTSWEKKEDTDHNGVYVDIAV